MRYIPRILSIAAISAILSTAALAAPKAERANKYFTIAGTVLRIDDAQRTLLVQEQKSGTQYLIEVPEGVSLKILFGRYMAMSQPGFSAVNRNDRIRIRCKRTSDDHFSLLDNSSTPTRITATN